MTEAFNQVKPLAEALAAINKSGLTVGEADVATSFLLGNYVRFEIHGLPAPGGDIPARAKNPAPYLAVTADNQIFFCGSDNVTCSIKSATAAVKHVLQLATGGYQAVDGRAPESPFTPSGNARQTLPPSPAYR